MVDKGDVQYVLMDLTSLDRQEYYNGFANRALWPTMHYRVGLSDFSRADYIGYRRGNNPFSFAPPPLPPPPHPLSGPYFYPLPLPPWVKDPSFFNPTRRLHPLLTPTPRALP